MAKEVGLRETKLIQYLNEAYGKEKQLEQALQAHIKMTDVAPYKKKLQEHLKETKGHARELQKRIKALGGKAEAVDVPGPDAVAEAASKVASVAGKAVAAAQGAVQTVRGTSHQEQLLKNAKDEYHEEAEEIANYTAIQTLAEALDDKETVKLAKAIIREEQRMAKYLEGLIPRLTKSVVTAEIPAKQRKPQPAAAAAKPAARSTARASKPAASKPAARKPAARSAAKPKTSSASKTAARKPAAKRTASKSAASRSRSTAAKSSNGSSGSTRAKAATKKS